MKRNVPDELPLPFQGSGKLIRFSKYPLESFLENYSPANQTKSMDSNSWHPPVMMDHYVSWNGYSMVRARLRNGGFVEGILRKNPALKHYPYMFDGKRYEKDGRFWDTPNPLDIVILSKVNDPILSMNRSDLESKIHELKSELKRCEDHLHNLRSREIWELEVGEELEDGSTMLMKGGEMALVVSPEFSGSWHDSSDILWKHGPQWWLPTVEQLNMAAEALPGIFKSGKMFWSCEGPDNSSYSYTAGRFIHSKTAINPIRGFRCITFPPIGK